MKVAVVFLTKTPQDYTIEFAKETSKEFDTFIVVDDENFESNDDMFICIKDSVCESQNYAGCNINETSTHIPKKIISWDKFVYHFCEIRKEYDFVWVFEDDVFIHSVDLIRKINRLNNYDLVTANNFKKNDSIPDWHWKSIFERIKPPYYNSMVCAMGLSRNTLKSIKNYVLEHKSLFHIEALFNTIAMQNKLSVVTPMEFITIVWKGNWDILDYLYMPSNFFHPVKQNHYEIRKSMNKLINSDDLNYAKRLPNFIRERMANGEIVYNNQSIQQKI
jgi:hypothetical protein